MNGRIYSVIASTILALVVPSAGNAMTITKGQPVSGQAGDKTCDLVAWIDANGMEREIALVQATGDGNYKGGYVTRYTYYVGTDQKTGISWDSLQQGVSGLGCAVNHYASTAASSKGGSNASTGFVFEGDHHCIWQWQGTMSMGANVQAKIRWYVADGRSDILWAVSYDCSGSAAGAVSADARGPYFQFDWDGCGDFYGSTISGIRWGDKYKFRTSTYNRENSSWDYTQPNTIPYMMLYKDAGLGDVECGVVQTQPWTVQDAGGYWWADNWGKTGTPMPENWNCPYQLNAYEGYGGEKMAWGSNFGYVGSSAYDVLGYERQESGYPHQGYVVSIVLNKHSEGLTDATIGSYEAVQNTALTASVGTVVTSGPDHVGLAGDVAYQPAGWDHVKGMWAVQCNGANTAAVNLNVASGSMIRPVFRFAGYTDASPGAISLDDAPLVAGTEYYASVDTGTDTLYVTLVRTLSGSSNSLSLGAGGSVDLPPSVSISSPAAGSIVAGTVTVTVTATDDSAMTGVNLMLDSGLLGAMSNIGGNTWSIDWDTSGAPEGDHTLSAIATDDADTPQQTTSAAVSVEVANSGDSDGDGVDNLDELVLGTDINDPDSDDDGLTDGEEVAMSTNPLDSDSDDDGMLDGWEADNGFDPTSAADASLDADSDEYSNLMEFLAGSDPNDPNSTPASNNGGSSSSSGGVSCIGGIGYAEGQTPFALGLLFVLAAVMARPRPRGERQ